MERASETRARCSPACSRRCVERLAAVEVPGTACLAPPTRRRCVDDGGPRAATASCGVPQHGGVGVVDQHHDVVGAGTEVAPDEPGDLIRGPLTVAVTAEGGGRRRRGKRRGRPPVVSTIPSGAPHLPAAQDTSRPRSASGRSPAPGVDGLPRPGRCLVMGVLNVTPDSFSDGGRFLDPPARSPTGSPMAEQGADLVDVGGESTRPGAHRPSVARSWPASCRSSRPLPHAGVAVSVDTMRAAVAEAAVEAGAVLVNDVSGGRADPAMLPDGGPAGRPLRRSCTGGRTRDDAAAHGVRRRGRPTWSRSWRSSGTPRSAAGIDPRRVALDPGIGFSKTAAQNWEVLAGLDRLHALGPPGARRAPAASGSSGSCCADDGDRRRVLRPPQRDDATTRHRARRRPGRGASGCTTSAAERGRRPRGCAVGRGAGARR